jgi:hypothetical protein
MKDRQEDSRKESPYDGPHGGPYAGHDDGRRDHSDSGPTAARSGKGDAAFEQRARRVFDDSVDALDAATLSRLNRARQTALARRDRDGLTAGWRPVATAAVVAVLAVALWLGQAPEAPGPEPEAVVAVAPEQAEDLEIVLQDDHLDMLADLEFYDWVGSEEALKTEPAGSGNIG